MSLCRLMCMDFMEGIGQYDDHNNLLYNDADLDEGAAYVEWLIEEGYINEPFYQFNLKKFRDWCLKSESKARHIQTSK